MHISEFFQKKRSNILHNSQNRPNFAVAKTETVAWMSGLVTGLQNRAQRFESASDLNPSLTIR